MGFETKKEAKFEGEDPVAGEWALSVRRFYRSFLFIIAASLRKYFFHNPTFDTSHRSINLLLILTVLCFVKVFPKSSELWVISSRSSRNITSLLSWRVFIALNSSLKPFISSRILRMSSVNRFLWWQLLVRLLALAWSSEISDRSSAIELDSHSVNFSFFGDTPCRRVFISLLQKNKRYFGENHEQ